MAFTWNPIKTEKVVGLSTIKDITTFHIFGYPDFLNLLPNN